MAIESTTSGVEARLEEPTTNEIDLSDYELSDIRRSGVSHTLEKVDAILEYEDRTYDLTITEHPDGEAWVRASPTETSEVYRGRLDLFPHTEASVEQILNGEVLDRAY